MKNLQFLEQLVHQLLIFIQNVRWEIHPIAKDTDPVSFPGGILAGLVLGGIDICRWLLVACHKQLVLSCWRMLEVSLLRSPGFAWQAGVRNSIADCGLRISDLIQKDRGECGTNLGIEELKNKNSEISLIYNS